MVVSRFLTNINWMCFRDKAFINPVRLLMRLNRKSICLFQLRIFCEMVKFFYYVYLFLTSFKIFHFFRKLMCPKKFIFLVRFRYDSFFRCLYFCVISILCIQVFSINFFFILKWNAKNQFEKEVVWLLLNLTKCVLILNYWTSYQWNCRIEV